MVCVVQEVNVHRDAFGSVLRDAPIGMSREFLAEWLMSRLQAERNRYEVISNALATEIAIEVRHLLRHLSLSILKTAKNTRTSK